MTGASTIAFLFENRNYAGSNYDNANYIRSVNQIESLTGLNLFANLPDGIEETAEANTNWTSFQNYATQ